jgi:hypothetical protein
MALLAMVFAVVVLGATPASADVDCADLTTGGAAQAYFDGRATDLDRLDADGDGRACESNDPNSYGQWSLPGLIALMLGALVLSAVKARRKARTRADLPAAAQRLAQRTAQGPARRLAQQAPGGILAPAGRKQTLLDAAPDGSLGDLARALRVVPPAKRISLVELYAVAHDVEVQDVLDVLASQVTDVGLQRWASIAYDPRPSTAQ